MKVDIIKNHSLLDKQYQITFKHINGAIVSMLSGINPMSNNWVYWFNVQHTMWVTDKSGIKDIVKEIRKKAEVYYDNYKFVK